MTAPEGGFYSAEDADSEGVEGKFYVWTQEELGEMLGQREADLVIRVFGVEAGGNFSDEASGDRTGANVLHLQKPMAELAADLDVLESELRRRVEKSRQELFAHREQRIHPFKDDKVLTDWNGLMIAALAKGARAFDEPRYADAAERAARFILEEMVRDDGRLLHRYRDGEAALLGYAGDYAFLAWGLLELYEATFEVAYLEHAIALSAELVTHYWDRERGGFYSTANDGEELLVRQKEVYDGAVPSANSVAMWNLLRVSRITADPDLEQKASQLGRAFSRDVAQSPIAHTQLMIALDFAVGPSYEVVIAGRLRAKDTRAMLRALRAQFVPNKVVLFRPSAEESPDIMKLAEFIKYQRSIDGKATAYVCLNYNCQLPTTDPSTMLQLLDAAQE